MLRKQFPGAVPVMEAARDDVLAFLCFPQEHWRKIWSTNPLERQEEWQLERRRFFSEATMAKIPEPEAMLEFSESDPAIAMAPAIR